MPADIPIGESWHSHLQRDTGCAPVPWGPVARHARPACFRSTCLLGLLIIFFLQSTALLPAEFSAATVFFSERVLWSGSTSSLLRAPCTSYESSQRTHVVLVDVFAPAPEGRGATSVSQPEPLGVWFAILLSVDRVFSEPLLSSHL